MEGEASKLLNLLQVTAQELREVLQPENAEEEKGTVQISKGHGNSDGIPERLFDILRKFCALHTDRMCIVREVLCGTANTLTERRMCSNLACTLLYRGSQEQTASVDDGSQDFFQDHVTDVILNALEDVHIIVNQLRVMTRRLDAGIEYLSEVRGRSVHTGEENRPLDTTEQINRESCDISTSQNQHLTNKQPMDLTTRSALDEVKHDAEFQQETRDMMSSPEKTAENMSETIKTHWKENLNMNDGSRREENERSKHDVITVGLKEQSGEGSSESPIVCYVTAQPELAEVLMCKVVDGLSSLMVSGSEELVSCVIRIEKTSHVKCLFPLTVAVPFQASHRGNYREITVKVVDLEQRVSHVTPVSTDGFYGGQRGSYAVVRVYSLGVFAVLSRLRTESFTVPKSGISLKLSADSRICLDYLPGSFTVPVVAQVKIQPVDAAVLSSIKSKNDSYHAVMTSTPFLYLSQPSALKLRRPMSVLLPCPPNSDKKRAGEESAHRALASSILSHQGIRVNGAVLKSPKDSKEQLAVLGWMENHWHVLDNVNVRNLQNGLLSFELTESYDRLIVLRLQPSIKTSILTSLVQDLEKAVRIFLVTIQLHCDPLDPRSVVVATLPSRDLSDELSELQALAYCGSRESSSEIFMREGEQLLLRFSGNITCNDNQETDSHIITFHNQRRNRLYLKLKEVDQFGNYSSPHYKGVVSLFRVSKEHLIWNGDRAALSKDSPLEELVCRLPLTLPKGARQVCRPVAASVVHHSQPDSLSDDLLSWICDELTEDDAALLVESLHVRRSAVQIARLRAPHNLSQRVLHILTAWRRGLPSSSPKCPLLAHSLTLIGRPDLAKELLLRESAEHKIEQRKPGEM